MLTIIFKRLFLFVAVSIFSFNLHAADWTMASGYPKSNFHTQNIIKFIDDVKSTTSVNINLNPNDTLIKLDAIKTYQNVWIPKRIDIAKYCLKKNSFNFF